MTAAAYPSCCPLTDREITTAPGARLVLDGWYHEARYYDSHLEVLRRKWLRTAPCSVLNQRADDICVILSISRRAVLYRDIFSTTEWPLPQDVASDVHIDRNAIREAITRIPSLKPGRVSIITDTPDDEILSELRYLSPKIVATEDLESMQIALSHKRLAASLYPFDWWAAVLSPADDIFLLPAQYAELPPHVRSPQQHLRHLVSTRINYMSP